MPQTYRFQVSMPVTDTLPRNRMTNVLHFEHTTGGILNTDLQTMCSDIVALYQARYGKTTAEVMCKAYDVDAVPNYPRATAVVNTGVPWTVSSNHELALCLSWHGGYAGNKRERGRIYLMPQLAAAAGTVTSERPGTTAMNWALDFYRVSNGSFPDIGGVDWKFGTWSRVGNSFKQSQVAWVDDEWDVQRRRGLKATTRVTSTREG